MGSSALTKATHSTGPGHTPQEGAWAGAAISPRLGEPRLVLELHRADKLGTGCGSAASRFCKGRWTFLIPHGPSKTGVQLRCGLSAVSQPQRQCR